MKISKKLVRILSVLPVFVSTCVWAAETYQIDSAHSSFGFSVTHLMVSTVPGSFTDFSGSITLDKENAANSSAEVVIKTASINTNIPNRDDHLRSPDFFDVERYPEISFKSTSFSGEGGSYAITGNLTMRGVTKEVSIPVSIAGPVASPMGGEVIGLTGAMTINRQDFDIKWNKSLDAGGVVVSDNVKVNINIEAVKK